jgi:hypothetical protein
MFESKVYNQDYYNDVINNYNLGKKYNIVQWEWGFDSNKKSTKDTIKIIECPNIQDFNKEIWDFFAEFAQKKSYHIIWGAFGLENRNPEKPKIQYYDGLIFHLIRKEFVECIENQNVSRFMSCLIHFNYFNLDFEVID